jgi:membrane-bound lytic murein transglycosylase D
MKKRTIALTLSLLVAFGIIINSVGVLKAQTTSKKDSNFIYDSPVVAQLDSLANSVFFRNEKFTTDISKLNKYNFPKDSIPIYPDSVYRARIDYMSKTSPFEFVYNDQVKAYVELYAYKKRKLTSRMLGLAELYFPLFEEQLDIYGIPLEMKYLPIIESALNPIARSRVGASGLWQFMLTTGKLYNLQATSYVDDRQDVYKSTVAACKHLRDLYNIYHDWAIVLAAYNAGPGTINRAIRTANLDSNQRVSYWNIRSYLPLETQNYVPAFIGVAYIMSYATEHNIYPTAPDYFYCQTDTITLRKSVTFGQIASYLCIPYEQVQFLNPAFKKGIIPATPESPYVLVLPRQHMADFLNNQESIYAYKTAEDIQHEKDLALAAANKTVVTNTQATTTQVKTTYTNTQTATNNTNNGKPPTYSKYVYHVVQKGDSLWSIAGRYKGTNVDEIRRLNGLNKSAVIYPGQKLKIGVTG